MIFKLIYLILTFAISFGGTIRLGGFTPRQAMAIIMFIICVINIKTIKPYLQYFLPLYLCYLSLAFLSTCVDGFAATFSRNLISQHLVAMVCCASMFVYYKREVNFNIIVNGFLICGFLNAFVCLLQYIGNPIGISIGYLFIGEEDVQANRHMEQLIDGSGSGYLLGMRSDAVHNGYFMMIMPFLLIHLYKQFHNYKFKLIKNVLLILGLVLLFTVILLIQERSCILLSTLVFLFYLWIMFESGNHSQKKRFILGSLIILGLLLYFALPPFLEYLSESRFTSTDQGVRVRLLNGCFDFIPSNLLLGGWQSFIAKYDFPPHNYFLNACVEAGIFGLFIASVLYLRQIKTAISISRYNNNSLICYAFLAYTLNSQLHNDSIMTGDAIVWLLWGMVLSIYKDSNYQNVR